MLFLEQHIVDILGEGGTIFPFPQCTASELCHWLIDTWWQVVGIRHAVNAEARVWYTALKRNS